MTNNPVILSTSELLELNRLAQNPEKHILSTSDRLCYSLERMGLCTGKVYQSGMKFRITEKGLLYLERDSVK